MTGRGKKISETKSQHLKTAENKPQVPEDPCPDDEIYINSPQNNASEPQTKKAKNVSRQTGSKPVITQQQNLDVDKELESKEGFYSSLNLAQRDSVDVYEPHVTTVTGPEPTSVTLEPIKETNIALEVTPLPIKTTLPIKPGTSDDLKPTNVRFAQKYRKQILVFVGIVIMAFMASIFGGLIVGSAMSSMVADILQQKCVGESTTTDTSTIDTNTTMSETTSESTESTLSLS